MVKKLIGILMIFTLAFGLAACGSSNKDNDNANKNETTTNNNKSTNTASAGDAEKIFSQNCSSCHGGNLEGGVGPDLTKVGAKYNKDQILDIIKNGKKGGMPAGVIKGDDADKVATWLSEKK
ncbi:cytochrome c551 [Heyndrickxia vini]|uniref:Cytochrome c n=1 Tax=Heyndrickxia vini TaxID=1476025 RepID=A0ABX7E4T7_9BACI|nr:cytochrome c [Heyndrickxia vini]QQZ10303.1 cytochrome c [Heyndrickxia vini]